jgi:glycosyltransferase involved in cell wall biosynthesis
MDKHYAALTSVYEDLCANARTKVGIRRPESRLKVAFIGGRGVMSKYSGIEAYYEEVGRGLVELGHDVTIYCRNYFTPAVDTHHGMRLVRLPTVRSKHLETLIHTAVSTAHVLFTDCNIVHYHALGPALFSFIPRMFGKRTVVTVQGLDWQRKKWGRLAAAVLRIGEQAAFRLPNSTMVVSLVLAKHYLTRYGAETTYVPNGTCARDRQAGPKLRDWGIEPGKYILFLGRFSPEKNCHMLVNAYEGIATAAKLVLAGGSSYSDEYANELRSHGSERIRILDWVAGDELDELLTNAMIFVLPSDLEGLSLALLDAMGAGLCVLTSDIPENCEVIEGAGFTFRRGDIEDLRRMLRLLIADADIRQAAGRAAKQRVQERYLWPAITKQIETVYWNVIGWKDLVGAAQPSPVPASQHVAENVAST